MPHCERSPSHFPLLPANWRFHPQEERISFSHYVKKIVRLSVWRPVQSDDEMRPLPRLQTFCRHCRTGGGSSGRSCWKRKKIGQDGSNSAGPRYRANRIPASGWGIALNRRMTRGRATRQNGTQSVDCFCLKRRGGGGVRSEPHPVETIHGSSLVRRQGDHSLLCSSRYPSGPQKRYGDSRVNQKKRVGGPNCCTPTQLDLCSCDGTTTFAGGEGREICLVRATERKGLHPLTPPPSPSPLHFSSRCNEQPSRPSITITGPCGREMGDSVASIVTA